MNCPSLSAWLVHNLSDKMPVYLPDNYKCLLMFLAYKMRDTRSHGNSFNKINVKYKPAPMHLTSAIVLFIAVTFIVQSACDKFWLLIKHTLVVCQKGDDFIETYALFAHINGYTKKK